MVSEKDLLEAIEECKKDPITYNNIEKLANLYIVHDHLYSDSGYSRSAVPILTQTETVIGDYGDSEFLNAVKGMKSEKVWAVLDELLESTLKVINRRLYNGVLRKLDE